MTRPAVLGPTVDEQTRCVHWHSVLDVIAIKFACCGDYFPCYQCHVETADHEPETWPVGARDERAVLCGVCATELSVADYLKAGDTCPACGAGFNPGCRLHHDLYFDR